MTALHGEPRPEPENLDRSSLGFNIGDPANWWRTALIALGAVALVLLVVQVIEGGITPASPGTVAHITMPAR